MQTIKTEVNESNNAPRQIVGAVASRFGGALPKVLGAIVIIVALCAVPFWIFSWRSADAVVEKSVPTVYSVQVDPTPFPTPERIGHTSVGDASINCEDGETVIQLWRGGEVVGFACNLDMDKVRQVETGVEYKFVPPTAGELLGTQE